MKKKIIVISLLLLAGAAAYYFLVYRKKKQLKAAAEDIGGGKGPSSSGYKAPSGSFPLQKGSKGEKVQYLQRYLNTYHAAGLTVDGNFGAKTENALKKALNIIKVSESDYNKYVSQVIGDVVSKKTKKTATMPNIHDNVFMI